MKTLPLTSFRLLATALLLGLSTLVASCQKEQDAPHPAATATRVAQDRVLNNPGHMDRFLQPTQGFYTFSVEANSVSVLRTGNPDFPANTRFEGTAFYAEQTPPIGSNMTELIGFRIRARGGYKSMLTTSAAEINALRASGWERVNDLGLDAMYVYTSLVPGWVPLYRLRSDTRGHVFTTSEAERNALIAAGFIHDEGIACYVRTAP